MTSNDITSETILFYDGDCGFCNRSVTWILKNEAQSVLFFASLQSGIAEEVLSKHLPDFRSMETLILFHDGKVYTKSDAAFELIPFLKKRWRLFSLFRWVPRFIRNGVYDWISKNRKRLASMQSCQLPTNRHRFLDL